MMERLDFKSTRFDALSDTILIDGKKITVEIARDAFEAISKTSLSGEQAIIKAVKEATRLNHLVNIIPADDGKIQITAALMLNHGQYEQMGQSQGRTT